MKYSKHSIRWRAVGICRFQERIFGTCQVNIGQVKDCLLGHLRSHVLNANGGYVWGVACNAKCSGYKDFNASCRLTGSYKVEIPTSETGISYISKPKLKLHRCWFVDATKTPIWHGYWNLERQRSGWRLHQPRELPFHLRSLNYNHQDVTRRHFNFLA